METRAVINFFSQQGKAPKEIHVILTRTLPCFFPGRAKDLSAPLVWCLIHVVFITCPGSVFLLPSIWSQVMQEPCAHSSVGTATDYGLDGPGSNPSRDEIFHPSRPYLGPTQPPVQWVPSLSPGVEAGGAWD